MLFYYNEEIKTDVESVDDRKFLDWIDRNNTPESDWYDTIREYIEIRDFCREWEEMTGDFLYGSTAIRTDYFVTYAQEYADELGIIDVSEWPAMYIDWERAAAALSMDYNLISFGDTDYYTY